MRTDRALRIATVKYSDTIRGVRERFWEKSKEKQLFLRKKASETKPSRFLTNLQNPENLALKAI
jgi:hypothetical protein